MKYLLDTNICIYIIKQKPASVFATFNNILPGNIGISVITLAELQFGVTKSSMPEKNHVALQKFLSPLEIYDFNPQSAVIYGNIRSFLETKGTPIGPLDMLIAAHAISMRVSLVTNNEKEFSRVPNLKVENRIQ